MTDAEKIAAANAAATKMFETMFGLDLQIQMEAVVVLFRTVFITHVKPTHRLGLFQAVIKRVREDIRSSCK